jgi:hypothetical protein
VFDSRKMESSWLDGIAGGLAIVILLGGLFMLLNGASAMGQDANSKPPKK